MEDDIQASGAHAILLDAREEVAAAMVRCNLATGHGETLADLLGEMEWQVRELQSKAAAAELPSDREAARGVLARVSWSHETEADYIEAVVNYLRKIRRIERERCVAIVTEIWGADLMTTQRRLLSGLTSPSPA